MTLNVWFKIKVIADYQIIWKKKKQQSISFASFFIDEQSISSSVLAPVETSPNNITHKQTIPAIFRH